MVVVSSALGAKWPTTLARHGKARGRGAGAAGSGA